MIEKNIIITGGTDGIGLALSKRLIKGNYRIFIIGKNEEKGNKIINELNNKKIEFLQCDLSEKEQILRLSKKLNNLNSIDALVNNAGSIFEKRETNSLGIERTFALNHLSYFHLSLLLLEKLENSQSPRIINVASNAHKRHQLNLDDLENKENYNSWKAYCQSKLLNIFFTYSFNQKIKSKIICNCLHPGFVNSNFGNNNSSFLRFGINVVKMLFAISNDEASKNLYSLLIAEDNDKTNGKYFNKSKVKNSSKFSYDKNIGNFVWEKSLEYIN